MQLHDIHKSDTERMRQEIKNSYFSYTSDGFIQYGFKNDDEIHFLPACPKRLEFGSVVDFHFPQGKVSVEWHITNYFLKATIQYEHNCDLRIILPEFARKPEISINRLR